MVAAAVLAGAAVLVSRSGEKNGGSLDLIETTAVRT